jgi:hypothetical protein
MLWIDMAQDRDQWRARYWTFGFHEMLGSSWVAAQLMAPQEGLSSVRKYKYTQSIELLVRGISRRKAATYTQNNTNIE